MLSTIIWLVSIASEAVKFVHFAVPQKYTGRNISSDILDFIKRKLADDNEYSASRFLIRNCSFIFLLWLGRQQSQTFRYSVSIINCHNHSSQAILPVFNTDVSFFLVKTYTRTILSRSTFDVKVIVTFLLNSTYSTQKTQHSQ